MVVVYVEVCGLVSCLYSSPGSRKFRSTSMARLRALLLEMEWFEGMSIATIRTGLRSLGSRALSVADFLVVGEKETLGSQICTNYTSTRFHQTSVLGLQ